MPSLEPVLAFLSLTCTFYSLGLSDYLREKLVSRLRAEERKS